MSSKTVCKGEVYGHDFEALEAMLPGALAFVSNASIHRFQHEAEEFKAVYKSHCMVEDKSKRGANTQFVIALSGKERKKDHRAKSQN